MPAVGLGTGAYSNVDNGGSGYPECWVGTGGASGGGTGTCGGYVQTAVKAWLEAGGRRIDAANSYQDQVDVGQAMNAFIAASGTPRSDIFLLSKVGPSHPLGGSDVKAQFAGVLSDMGVDYVDML
jgi:diketogulonate reductase-like aldo/keto reductase